MKPPSRLAWIVEHPVFDYFFACAIVLNSAFIGAETEYKIRHFGNNPGASQLDDWEFMFSMAERTFAALFSIELLIRLAVLRLRFFTARGRGWNLFDMVLVGMSVVEIILDATTGTKNATGAGGMSGKVIRMFRMARIIRIMRVLRFLAELRVMVTLIAHSMRSLFWLMILLILILYVFSIFFTQGVHDYVSGMEERPASGSAGDQLLDYFGSLLDSAFTLFISITGGISWKEVITPLANIGETFTALFIIYIFFCIFSVLNIVTGVFVDGAIQRSSQERDLRLEKEREQKEAYVSMLLDLLEEIDFQKKGAITREELEVAFMNERTRHYFSVLDIDIADSNYLFDMLDLECSGSVDMEEFVAGCLRLKGSAKSIDVHQLMFEIKLSMKKWDRIMTVFLERKLRPDPAPDANNPHTSL